SRNRAIPVERSSTPTTLQPCVRSASTRLLPKKPQAPVTSALLRRAEFGDCAKITRLLSNRAIQEQALEGRLIVVTGGGRGIGRAIALDAVESGAKVVIAARTAEELEKTAREAPAGTILPVQTDVTSAAELARLFDAAKRF